MIITVVNREKVPRPLPSLELGFDEEISRGKYMIGKFGT